MLCHVLINKNIHFLLLCSHKRPMAGVHQPVPEEASTDRASERANNLIVQNTKNARNTLVASVGHRQARDFLPDIPTGRYKNCHCVCCWKTGSVGNVPCTTTPIDQREEQTNEKSRPKVTASGSGLNDRLCVSITTENNQQIRHQRCPLALIEFDNTVSLELPKSCFNHPHRSIDNS